MQHDTSPHKVMISGQTVKAQCVSLVFGFSRKLFVQYYPCFTSFEAKTFFQVALEFMTGSCQRCIIDNTSVILSAGSGPDAVISPEMVTFERFYGFKFEAHRIRHSDRKGKIERPFFLHRKQLLSWEGF